MKINNPNTWLLIAIIIVGTIAAKSCSAADGYYNSGGFSNEANGIQYYHGNDGNNGWQDEAGGVKYYHDDHKNCFTTSGNAHQTICSDY